MSSSRFKIADSSQINPPVSEAAGQLAFTLETSPDTRNTLCQNSYVPVVITLCEAPIQGTTPKGSTSPPLNNSPQHNSSSLTQKSTAYQIRQKGKSYSDFSLVILTSLLEATPGLFWDGPRNFGQRPDNEDDT
ncbi:hypothetical protein AVEN_225968-1 [Araneus ventricosus]|uniref:Uncharacterized protein n=1 Tax=Araneus ventricosus TaxID=182803 RepID=A0A4Y2PUA4_ARAVE|nr:hypothetical protein AVEN_225968-1 [Araneus ventricosus]